MTAAAPYRRSPLDLDHETMRRLGRTVADVVAEHLSTLRDQPVLDGVSRGAAEQLIAGPPPAQGSDFDTLLGTLRTRVFAHAAREPHPGFIAYVPSCPTFPAVLGDWLATGFNFFGGVWPMASGPNEVELVVLDWFRQWLGMPEGAGGLLTSGGSNANFTAVVAARHEAVGDDAGRVAQLVVYISDQTHSSAIRAAWMAGIPRSNVRQLPTNGDFRIQMPALAEAVASDRAAGLIPLMVVGNGGTTSTGAVDPLAELAEFCAAEQIWLHVDAAYGGFSVLTERGRRALAGIELADSVTMDPHKWLYVPFECGCLMVRDPRRLKAAFQIYPDYLKDAESNGDEVNFADYGEQLTRAARGLKVWLGVSYFGVDTLSAAIEYSMELAVHAERSVREEPTLEVLSPATLGILCFRAHPADLDDPAELDALNERVTRAINARGPWLISTTRVNGALALRICPIGFRTTIEDLEQLIRKVSACARATR
ncbi:MAG TPA: aminotransferase class I/II-fold pyridoxal phosphate-dependent enzyme [Gemmatimonadaceae bacterium]